MMMSFLCFVRRFVAMALLYSCQGADGRNETFVYPADFAGLSVDGCSCYHQGKIYNLRPLERDDGQPRYSKCSTLHRVRCKRNTNEIRASAKELRNCASDETAAKCLA